MDGQQLSRKFEVVHPDARRVGVESSVVVRLAPQRRPAFCDADE